VVEFGQEEGQVYKLITRNMSIFQNYKFLKRKSFLGKILRLPFRLIPDTAAVRIIRGPLAGKKWIKGSHNLSNLLGDYEVGQSRNFVKNVAQSKIMWDLGAHVGHYSLLYLSYSKGFVYAFEPDQRNYSAFEKHMRLNGISNYQVFPVAVSDKDQVLRFIKSKSSVAGKLAEYGELEVQAVSMLTLLAQGKVKPADVIKMDIEGAEYTVLVNLKDFLITNSPIIFLSTHGNDIHVKCVNLLTELGYDLTPLDNSTVEHAREVMARKLTQK
jgi:FkbM family methyltransferase